MKFIDLIPVGGTMKTKQREDILAFFREYYPASFTPCHVHKHRFHEWPITSVRTRIDELKKTGQMEETGKSITGLYGRSVRLVRFARSDAEQGVLL